MIFEPTILPGAYVIEPERYEDFRGSFTRVFCQKEFAAAGLEARIVQCSVSFNRRKGTLRGMHYQEAPYQEVKLVRCNRGSVYDVIVDLRRESPTFKRHFALELNEQNGTALYIPTGVAHGFQTLVDDTEVCYQMSEFYMPQFARGVRYSDPAFGIRWPIADPIILDRDATYPDFVLVPG